MKLDRVGLTTANLDDEVEEFAEIDGQIAEPHSSPVTRTGHRIERISTCSSMLTFSQAVTAV